VFDPPKSFALGNASATICPTNTAKVPSTVTCQIVAAVAGKPYGGGVMASFYVSGCYWHTLFGSFYFNDDVSGGGNYFAQPVCAGAPDLYKHSRAVYVCMYACI
jgi:hypothetical protein